MRAVLIYAGTTEGRTLAEKLAQAGIPSEVCVATEYGGQLMQSLEKTNLIKVRQGRLLPEQMRELLEKGDYLAVVDATHPYATLVTENVRRSIRGMNVPYYRLSRDLRETADVEKIGSRKLLFSHATAEECAKALAEGSGNVLLTTGSKELELFCKNEELRKRLVVRVLPGRESMELCWKCGLEGRQIVAMQGPFSKEMNLATIRQYHVTALVTKESGKIGGVDEKLEAALEAEIACHVIKPPAQSGQDAMSFDQVYKEVARLAGKDGIDIKNGSGQEDKMAGKNAWDHGRLKGGEGADKEGMGKEDSSESGRRLGKEEDEENGATLDVVLAGIGMGSAESRTVELEKRLAETDYLFGAKRMLEGLRARVRSYPYYLERDIIPTLKRIQRESDGKVTVTILFSGDAGFYSGAQKLLKALEEVKGAKVRVYPGISSIAALCAKFALSWQDAMILSTHGTEKEAWKAELLFGLRRARKIFFITSGAEDVREIGQVLKDRGFDRTYALKLGYQISYDNEKLFELNAEEARKIEAPGLYAGMLLKVEDKDAKEENTQEAEATEKREASEKKEPAEDKKAAEEKTVDLVTKSLCQITPGWKDEAFLRDKVPMTKEEVREVSICKLGLTEEAVVYDVGSGTGSIAMEIAALSPKIRVYALECKHEAAELLRKNRERFGAYNVKIIEAMAPEGMNGLPAPTHAFIGGSKGNLKEILDALREKNPKVRVVMNAISLESIAQMQTLIKEYPVTDLEVTTVSVSKAKQVGDYHLMQANNPVMIFSFTFDGE